MIIDADTHISPISGGGTLQLDGLIEQMDKSGVDKAICWLHPPYMREIDGSLRYIHECIQKRSDRLIGFGWVDPHLGLEKCRETIKRCLGEYGFHGIKLNGAQNSFYIDDEDLALPLVEEIAKAGTVLALHIGADEYDFTHPYRAGKLAELYPDLPILIVHMGGAGKPDLARPCVEMAAKHPNMTLIGSNVDFIRVKSAIESLGAQRVCFGSDTPFSIMHADVAAYQAFLSDYFTEDEQRLVMGGNIARVLRLIE